MRITVTHRGTDDYTVVTESKTIRIYKNGEVIRSIDNSERAITSAVHDGDRFIYNVGGNRLLYMEEDGNTSEIRLEYKDELYEYDSMSGGVQIIKLFEDYPDYIAVRKVNTTAVYDISSKKLLFDSPIQHDIADINMTKNGTSCVIGEDTQAVDDIETEYITHKIFNYDDEESCFSVKGKSSVLQCVNSWNDVVMSCNTSYKGMGKLPVFDYFLHDWPRPLCLSDNHVVYYCKQHNGLIISTIQHGNVHSIFRLPEGFNSNSCISFNEKSGVLTFWTGFGLSRYQLSVENPEIIERLNNTYDKAYSEKKSLAEDAEFNELFKQAVLTCRCTEI